MAVFLVTYELKTKNKDFGPLFEEIQSFGSWWHYMENVWIVSTNEVAADAMARRLFKHITQSDALLVTRLTRDYQGWLPKDAWDWLNKQDF
jgi:hypothetical protein